MRLCKDGEISSSGFKYVIIENVAGEGGGVSKVGLCMGCGASVGISFLCSCPMRGIRLVVSFHRCQRRWALAYWGLWKRKSKKNDTLWI